MDNSPSLPEIIEIWPIFDDLYCRILKGGELFYIFLLKKIGIKKGERGIIGGKGEEFEGNHQGGYKG